MNFVVIHVGLDHFPPLLFNALRFTLMARPGVFLVGRPRVPWRIVLGFGFLLGVVKFGLLFVSLDLGMPVGLSSLLLQLQVIFTIVFAGFVLRERPRREQVAGAAIAFAGLAVIGIDRAASAPVLPFLLILGAAAAWGVTQRDDADGAAAGPARDARLGEPRRRRCRCSASRCCSRGPAEIGDALAGVDAAGLAALLFVALVSGLFGFAAWTTLLKRHTAASVTPFALLVPVFGIASAALLLGERPERARAGRRGADLRRPGGHAAAGARAGSPGGDGGRVNAARDPVPVPCARTCAMRTVTSSVSWSTWRQVKRRTR